MHRQISTSFFQGCLQLFDKEAFATHFAQRAVQNLITTRRHTQERDVVPLLTQQSLDVFGLPKGQSALAGCNGVVRQSRNLCVIVSGLQC